MRKLTVLLVALLMLGLMAGPAAAHYLTVEGKEDAVWVGGGPLPENAAGKGLIPGGPGGIFILPPSHAKGLNTACYALEDNPSVADIRGPGGPGCPHGQ